MGCRQKLFRGVGFTAVFLLLLLLIGPFLIPIPPLTGVRPPQEVARPAGQFVTISYPPGATDTAEILFHYEEDPLPQADAPTFILLHGFAANLYNWDNARAGFASHGRVLAYDRIPFGLSGRPIAGDWPTEAANPYTDQAAQDQLLALLDHWQVAEAILVGNSAGGTAALKFALDHPQRVSGLILISPAVYTGGGSPLGPLTNTPQLRRLGPLVARAFASNDSLLELAYHDPSRITPEVRVKARASTQVPNWDKSFWEFTNASRLNSLTIVPRLDQLANLPILLVTGESDQIVPAADTRRLAEALPHATLVVIPACGHVPQEECPEALDTAVANWLSR